MHRGDRFTSDKTPPTLLSTAALTRGWKLTGSLHCQLLLLKWKSTRDVSQRRIWFLGGLTGWEPSGAAKWTCTSPPQSLVLQHSSCSAGTDQRDEGWATKTWAHQAQQVGAAGHCCLSCCPGCLCIHPLHTEHSQAQHTQAHPFLGLNIPGWVPIPDQHSCECMYLHSSEGTYLT